MEIKHLRLIKAVAEEGNLTKATQRLFLSQSALSHQLKEIETIVGTPVFLRLNRKLTLTDAGEVLFETANRVLKELEQSQVAIKRSLKDNFGSIQLCTECYTCYYWLPSIIKQYSIEYPNVEVEIQTDRIDNPLEQLVDADLDLAIVLRRVDSPNIHYEKLMDDELLLVVSTDNPLAKKKYASANDFKDQVLFTHNRNYQQTSLYEQLLIPASVFPERVHYIQITDAILEMVSANLGITVMSRWLLKPNLQNRKLTTISVGRKGLIRSWYLATHNKNGNDRFIMAFKELLHKNLGSE